MAAVRLQRLLRLIDESRPFQHGSKGHFASQKLEMAYREINLLADTSLMDLTADMILAFCLHACAHGDEDKASHVFQLFDKVGAASSQTRANGLLFRAFLETKQLQKAAVKGIVVLEQHVEAFQFVEKALVIAGEEPQSAPYEIDWDAPAL